ncbi:kinase-like domain-containing protein [Lentinula edodes]|uniref:kinase-like domain-containing protein n=1 Tax=Lentinula edodes TaxID=5353 RepID=UPI001E8EBFC4|nr:kinase-like domain-containing protein [Lentinula edodes]KAH7870246.1 kinase-like domain-containing protein [Lentinula edodes]
MDVRYPKVAGFDLVQQIGDGGSSKVFEAINALDNRVAACKVIPITNQTTDNDRKLLSKEARIHAVMKHEHVLELLATVIVELKYQKFYVPGVYMLIELAAGGELFDKITPDVGMGEQITQFYFKQLLAGVEYIHSKGICHRDLKPENLLLDVNGNLKVGDFGLSAVFRLGNGKTRRLSEKCGSLPYVAPEVISDDTYAAEPIDIWGTGVILFMLLVGKIPWTEPTIQSAEYQKYISGLIFEKVPWTKLSDDALSLICGLVTIDPSQRLTLSEAMQHPWYTRENVLAHQSSEVLASKLVQSASIDTLSQPTNQYGWSINLQSHQCFLYAHSSSLFIFSPDSTQSQTQLGTCYTPCLTWFHASLGPVLLVPIMKEALVDLGISYKESFQGGDYETGINGEWKLEIKGRDAQKMSFSGWIEMENFMHEEIKGSFCIMSRAKGEPLSWQQTFQSLLESNAVSPHIIRTKI